MAFVIVLAIGIIFNISFDILSALVFAAPEDEEYKEYKAFYVYSESKNDVRLFDKIEFYITNDNFSTGIIVLSTSENIKKTSSYIDYSNFKIYDENNNLVNPVSVSTLSSIEAIQYDDFDSYNALSQVYVLDTNKTYKIEFLDSYLFDKFESGNFNVWIHLMYNGSNANSENNKEYAKIDFVRRQVFDMH